MIFLGKILFFFSLKLGICIVNVKHWFSWALWWWYCNWYFGQCLYWHLLHCLVDKFLCISVCIEFNNSKYIWKAKKLKSDFMFWTCCHRMEWYYHALDNLITFIIKPCMCFSFESCLVQRIQWLPPWKSLLSLIHVTKSVSLFVNPLNIIKTSKFWHLLSLFQSQKLFTGNHVQTSTFVLHQTLTWI
jgi:hypothetical protein